MIQFHKSWNPWQELHTQSVQLGLLNYLFNETAELPAASWTFFKCYEWWMVLWGSPVDKVEEVLNHPIGRVCHLWQQEPVNDPVGVPVGYEAALVTVCTWHLGGLLAETPGWVWLWNVLAPISFYSSSDSPEMGLIIHSPIVEFPEAPSRYNDRIWGVYQRVELWVIFNTSMNLKEKSFSIFKSV